MRKTSGHSNQEKSVLLAGATGLVGSELLLQLFADSEISKVLVLGRREPPHRHPKLEWIKTDFEDLWSVASEVRAEILFCCLGTTRKKAKSPHEFRRVDFEFVRKLGRLCVYRGIPKFSLVSARSANLRSPWLYFRTKAEIEREILALPIPQIQIFRPSLLEGQRPESRLGEGILLSLVRSPVGRLFGKRHLLSCSTSSLAGVMLKEAKRDSFEKRVYEMEDISGGDL